MFCCLRDAAGSHRAALEAVARACSPWVEQDRGADTDVVFDVRGLARVVGPPDVIAAEVERLAIERGLKPLVAIAGTMIAARLLVCAGRTKVVVAPGDEATALSELPLMVLQGVGEAARGPRPEVRGPRLNPALVAACLASFRRWGLQTLGDLARLPEADVRARLGETGARLHQAARGQDAAPLVPLQAPVRFHERIELEWPIEGIEPLSFVLSRLCESLAAALDRADRGAVAIVTRLRLVTRATHERVLHLPAPMREARVFRTLILLDLESHPPQAAIDAVGIDLEVAPGRIVQGSLLTRALPSAEDLATLLARLRALMGESRVGTPALADSYDERAVVMGEFAPREQGRRQQAEDNGHERTDAGQLSEKDRWRATVRSLLPPSAFCLLPSLRRYRLPVAAAVEVARGTPTRVRASAHSIAGGRVVAAAGPWRSSGHWWRPSANDASTAGAPWDIDVWDVELGDGVYRLARHRGTGRWEVEGTLD